MSAASITAEGTTTRQVAGDAAERPVDSIMRAVKARFAHKPAAHLAEILGCDISTAERYFAGARTPNFENAVTMIRHPVTCIAMVEEATKSLPADEFRKFWDEMTRAALRASLRNE